MINQDSDTPPSPNKPLDGVPDYATCDAETRAALDEIIATINSHDVNTVVSFGREPLEKLGSLADEILNMSDIDNNQELKTIEDIQESLSSLDLSDLTSKVAGMGMKGVDWVKKNPGTAIATIGASTFLGPLAFVGVPFAKGKLDEMKFKREGGDIGDKLRKSVVKTTHIMEALENAREQIPEAISSLNRLGNARLVTYAEVSLYIGAGLEKLKRIDEQEIPALESRQQESYSHEAELDIEDMRLVRDMLDKRLTDMLASRVVSQTAVVTLHRLKTMFAVAAGRVESHITLSVPQWKAQMAESGVALVGYRIALGINEADSHGTKLLQQGAKLSDKTARMMIESSTRGTYDPEKVVKVMAGLTTSLKQDFAKISARRGDMEAQRALLSDASAKFKETIGSLAETGRRATALPTGGRTLAIGDRNASIDPS